MKKLILWTLSAASILMTSTSYAATRFQFLPGGFNGMVFVKSGGFDGSTDSDFATLWQFMDVPPQDSITGKGKSIVTASQDFNLVCGESHSQCQVVLKKSSRVKMNPTQRTMSFEVRGEEADQLFELLTKNQEGLSEFITEDRQFRLFAEPGHFLFEAREGGI